MNINIKRTITHIIFIVLSIWVGLLPGFSWISGAEAREVIDRIVAVVNDDIISLYKLNMAMKPEAEKIRRQNFSLTQERHELFKLREKILSQFINQKLADQEINRLNIVISKQEVDSAVERIKAANAITDEQLRDALANQGMSLESYHRELKEEMLRARLVNRAVKAKIVITDADIKTYYNTHANEYRGEKKYHLRNIIMRPPIYASEKKKRQVYQKMEAVLEELKSGTPFSTLARSYSESSLAASGGDLGLFSAGSLSPQILAALEGLPPGGVTSVLDTDQGYQIFYIEEIINTTGKTIEEVSAEIEEKLYKDEVNEKYNSWLKGLYSRSHIKLVK